MRPRFLIALLLVLVLTAGCIQSTGGGDDENGSNGDTPVAPGHDGEYVWPGLSDAVVRPGVRVISDSGSCTSNFVFTSKDNSTLYLGLAAHCLPGEEEHETVDIAGGVVQGTVAYNSWYTMDNTEGEFAVSRDTNDFALIQIPDEHRHLVHPAVLHFGGPVGLAESASVSERIITYGNTPIRDGAQEANPREGFVVEGDSWYTRMYIVTPGLPGDSGSAVLMGDGRALGVLIHLGIAPLAASNGAVNLAAALSFAEEYAGIEVELATWEILDGGLFPDRS